MHQLAPLLLGLLGDSSQTPNVEQEKRMKDEFIELCKYLDGDTIV